MPNILYYLQRGETYTRLNDAAAMLKKSGTFFISMRLLDDYRYGRGKLAGKNAYILDIHETGEQGLLNVFYDEYELVDMVAAVFKAQPEKLTVLKTRYENIQSEILISNHDIIIWGKKGE